MKQISLTRDKIALVDDKDYERVNSKCWRAQKSSTQSTWYAVESGNPWLSMHRFIMRCPADKVVDHADHDGLNNQRSNLRITTISGNCHNADARGYYWETARQKWYASITVDGKKTLLGRFDSEIEAAAAYQAAKALVLAQIFGGGNGDVDVEGEDADVES